MKPDNKTLLAALKRLGSPRVAVVGDLLADVYVYARPVSLSREAPVMVVHEEGRKTLAGGAANAANNVLALAGKATCVGIVGSDGAGKELKALLSRRRAVGGTIVSVPRAQTYTKTRVLAGGLHTVKQQVFRLDSEPANRMSASVGKRVLAAMGRAAAWADAWLVSDYDGDMFPKAVIAEINRLAKRGIVVVDSHTRLSKFLGVTCVTPNEEEASREAGVDIVDDRTAVLAGRKIRAKTGAKWVFITRGNRGMTIVGSGETYRLPIVGSSDIVDVAGAGDTVAAVVTLAMANGDGPLVAGLLASYAASVVCMKTGVATATAAEVEAAIGKYPVPRL